MNAGEEVCNSTGTKTLKHRREKAKVRGLGKTQNASTFVLKTEIRNRHLAHRCA